MANDPKPTNSYHYDPVGLPTVRMRREMKDGAIIMVGCDPTRGYGYSIHFKPTEAGHAPYSGSCITWTQQDAMDAAESTYARIKERVEKAVAAKAGSKRKASKNDDI